MYSSMYNFRQLHQRPAFSYAPRCQRVEKIANNLSGVFRIRAFIGLLFSASPGFAFLLICFLPFASKAQTLHYDFATSSFDKKDLTDQKRLKPVHTGTFTNIEIKNINTFLYEVQIKGRSIEYATRVPSDIVSPSQ